jgi:WD40 repeat protein
VQLWDLNTRQVVRELSQTGYCNGLSFSEDGQTLVTSSVIPWGGNIAEVALWRVADGSKVAGWSVGLTGSRTGDSWFAATRDASAAAVVTAGSTVSVIDLKTGRERWSAVATEDGLKCLAFSTDGRVLASGAGYVDTAIRLWDAETGKPLGRLEGQRGWTTGLVFLNDGKHLVSASGDQTLRLWDLETHSVERVFRGHKLEVHALSLAADQRTLLSGGKDGSAYLWDLTAERSASSSGRIGKGLDAWAFADGGKEMVTVGRDGQVVRRHGRTFQEETLLLDLGTLSSNSGLGSVLSPKRPLLAVMTAAEKIQVWNWERRARVREWEGRDETGLNMPVFFSADGTKLFVINSRSSTPKPSLREWDLATGRETRPSTFPTSPESLFFHPTEPR